MSRLTIWAYIAYGALLAFCVTFAYSFAMFQDELADKFLLYSIYFENISEEMEKNNSSKEAISYINRLSSYFCNEYARMIGTVLLPDAGKQERIFMCREPDLSIQHILRLDMEHLETEKTGLLENMRMPRYIFDMPEILLGESV